MCVSLTKAVAFGMVVLTVLLDLKQDESLDMGNMALPLSLELNQLSGHVVKLVP
jgi:hypothetical protein